ncbi:hypothetical protein [Virgibacillus doumboii]|uniref:hypothetical protein n=1 Tax=Virgibacillus doumboii TaxID=2697503 RepID=UPI0013E0499C|nr:hypothetical protein [Virgibacillus doumboii]
MTLRAGLLLIILISFFIGVWSTDYSMQGYIVFGFLGITGVLNVLTLGTGNKEIAKTLKESFL